MKLIGNQKLEPNFQWPSLTEMESLPTNKRLSLNKLVFKQGPALKGIKMCFTNDIESDMFETEAGQQLKIKEQDIDISKRIARIGVYVCHQQKTNRSILGIQFLGEEGMTVKNYEMETLNDLTSRLSAPRKGTVKRDTLME